MTTTPHTQLVHKSFAGRMASVVSPETRQLVALGQGRGWEVAVLGRAPMLTEPLRLGDWLLVPVEQDSSYMPTRALERVQAIYSAGLRPRGFIVVHEAPMQLPAPGRNRPERFVIPDLKPVLTPAIRAIGLVALGVGAIAGLAVLAVVVISLAFVLLMPVVLLAGVAGLDPILVAVTEDGFWIEVDRWTE